MPPVYTNSLRDDTLAKPAIIYYHSKPTPISMDSKPPLLSPAARLMMSSVFMLALIGVVMLYSTSMPVHGTSKIISQCVFLGIGTTVCFSLKFFDYRCICRASKWILLIIGIPLIYLALANIVSKFDLATAARFPLTKRIKGAYRWLFLPGFSIQPSEFAKVAILIFMAQAYHHFPQLKLRRSLDCPLPQKGISRWKRFKSWSANKSKQCNLPFHCKPMLIAASFLGLILAGRSLSVTILASCIVVTCLFLAGVKMRWFIIPPLLIIGLVALIISVDANRMARVDSFLNPEDHIKGKGYQLAHSHYALGGGGTFGRGMNKSLMKNEFLPEAHTDFIVAVLGEEWGFIGVSLVILLYFGLLVFCFRVAAKARDTRGAILAGGAGASLVQTALLNLAVVSGTGPTTGVTAPFISYGGSSLLAASIMIGLVLSVDHYSRHEDNHNAIVPPPLPEGKGDKPKINNSKKSASA